MSPTIRDVARHAGVSIATVSRVMHDHANVSAATRSRVTLAIEELAFTPSRLGRSLAERRHAANGIVFPDLSGPYYAEVVLGYESVAADLGRSVLILSTHGRSGVAAMVEEMAGRCDGLVISMQTVPDEVVERLAARGVPMVLLARTSVAGVDSVKADNTASSVALVEHVIATGARHLALVGDAALSPDLAERWAGAETTVRSHRDVTLTRVLTGAFDEGAGAEVARAAVRDGLPDAFVCANDELALGVLAELGRLGVDVPGQVAVTGWDDIMAARYAGLTTVRQPMRQLGREAARLLDELITGARSTPRHEVLPTELVVRTSTGTREPRKHSETLRNTRKG